MYRKKLLLLCESATAVSRGIFLEIKREREREGGLRGVEVGLCCACFDLRRVESSASRNATTLGGRLSTESGYSFPISQQKAVTVSDRWSKDAFQKKNSLEGHHSRWQRVCFSLSLSLSALFDSTVYSLLWLFCRSLSFTLSINYSLLNLLHDFSQELLSFSPDFCFQCRIAFCFNSFHDVQTL